MASQQPTLFDRIGHTFQQGRTIASLLAEAAA